MDILKEKFPHFPTSYSIVLERISNINPEEYGTSRKYLNGQVTYLLPYISRGIISTWFILSQVLSRGFKWNQIEKLIQEFAWRNFCH